MQSRAIARLAQTLALAGAVLLQFGGQARAGEVVSDVYDARGRLPDGGPVLGAMRWVFVERMTVPADSIWGTTSATVLDASGRYALRASGVWVNVHADFLVDAEYSVFQGVVRDGHPPDPQVLDANWGDLRIDGMFVDWGPYAADHVYWLEMPGTGAAVRLNIHDGYPNGDAPPLWYEDNSGSLIVEIYESSDPVPDCVCPIAQRKLPLAVIADALAHPEHYYGWLYPQDPNKPPSSLNPPRTCLSLREVGLAYHPVWNTPRWRVGCP